jgi:hypothetical protein
VQGLDFMAHPLYVRTYIHGMSCSPNVHYSIFNSPILNPTLSQTSTSQPNTLYLRDPIQHYPPIYAQMCHMSSSLQITRPNYCINLSYAFSVIRLPNSLKHLNSHRKGHAFKETTGRMSSEQVSMWRDALTAA